MSAVFEGYEIKMLCRVLKEYEPDPSGRGGVYEIGHWGLDKSHAFRDTASALRALHFLRIEEESEGWLSRSFVRVRPGDADEVEAGPYVAYSYPDVLKSYADFVASTVAKEHQGTCEFDNDVRSSFYPCLVSFFEEDKDGRKHFTPVFKEAP